MATYNNCKWLGELFGILMDIYSEPYTWEWFLLHIEYPELISFVVVPSCLLSLAATTVNMLVGQQHGQFKIRILKRLKYRVTKFILVTIYNHLYNIEKIHQAVNFVMRVKQLFYQKCQVLFTCRREKKEWHHNQISKLFLICQLNSSGLLFAFGLLQGSFSRVFILGQTIKLGAVGI